jgi:branched-subunit amino acid ABC-type transport system permease component
VERRRLRRRLRRDGHYAALPSRPLGRTSSTTTIAHFWISVPGLVETVMFGAIVLVLMVRPSGLLGRAA